MPLRFWLLTIGCAMLPDVDAVAFWFGAPRESIFSHRGITHSIFFAAVVGTIIALAAFPKGSPLPRWQTGVYFFLVTLSHLLLDMLTNGGSGVALFAPLSSERYFWPWRPIEVSPIGLGFFSERGLAVFASELLWVWLPAGLVLGASMIYKRLFRSEQVRD